MWFAIPSLINLMWLLQIEALKLDWFHIPVINEYSVGGFEKWDLSFVCLPQDTFWIRLISFFAVLLLSILVVQTPYWFYLIISILSNIEPIHTSTRVPLLFIITPKCLCFTTLHQHASTLPFYSKVPFIFTSSLHNISDFYFITPEYFFFTSLLSFNRKCLFFFISLLQSAYNFLLFFSVVPLAYFFLR